MLIRGWELSRLFENEADVAGESAAAGAAVESAPVIETSAAETSAPVVETEARAPTADERIDATVQSALDEFRKTRDPNFEPGADVESVAKPEAPANTEQATSTSEDTNSGSDAGDSVSDGQVDPVLVRVAARYGVSAERAAQLGNQGIVAVLETLTARAEQADQQRAAQLQAQPGGAGVVDPGVSGAAAQAPPNPTIEAIEKLRAAGDVDLANALLAQHQSTHQQFNEMQARMEHRFQQQFQGVNQLVAAQRNNAIISELNRTIEGINRPDLFGAADAPERTPIEKANLAKLDTEFREQLKRYPQAPVAALAEDAYAFAFRDRLAKETKQAKVKDLVAHSKNIRGATTSATPSPTTEFRGDIRQDPEIKSLIQRFKRERGAAV